MKLTAEELSRHPSIHRTGVDTNPRYQVVVWDKDCGFDERLGFDFVQDAITCVHQTQKNDPHAAAAIFDRWLYQYVWTTGEDSHVFAHENYRLVKEWVSGQRPA